MNDENQISDQPKPFHEEISLSPDDEDALEAAWDKLVLPQTAERSPGQRTTMLADGINATSRQQTAKRAAQILVAKNLGFLIPTAKQKQNLLIAFAKRNMVIYGNAFDALKLLKPVNLDNLSEIEKKFDDIILYEVKSTNRKDIGPDFSGYFFALTTAELLVAQNLKKRYKFVMVNVVTESFVELTLNEVFAKAKGIYPTWSIRF